MKKNLLIGLIVITSSAIFFLIGASIGKNATSSYIAEDIEMANVEVTFGHYIAYRGIARDQKAGNFEGAKCKADLAASAMLDSVKYCLASQPCAAKMNKEVLSKAPEILEGTPLNFSYIESKEGIKRCNR